MNLWQNFQVQLLLAYDTTLAQLPPADCTGVNLVKPIFTRVTAILLGFVGPWLIFVAIVGLLAAAAVVIFRRRLQEVLRVVVIVVLLGTLLPALLAFAPTFISSQC